MLSLKRKLGSADDLHSVVRSMKSIAAANIGQYDQAIDSLAEYYRTIELGLIASLQNKLSMRLALTHIQSPSPSGELPVGVIIFGSDQGLVGQFNEALLSFMHQTLAHESSNAIFWPIGERIQSGFVAQNIPYSRYFLLPRKIDSITSLVTDLLVEIDANREQSKINKVYLFFNNPTSNIDYSPCVQTLLPFDKNWQQKLISQTWQGRSLPELITGQQQCLISLLHEYLFVSLFKACVSSLASENTSRLAAMSRAEKNIEELKTAFNSRYQSQRQASIDEELFDLIGGFEAMNYNKPF